MQMNITSQASKQTCFLPLFIAVDIGGTLIKMAYSYFPLTKNYQTPYQIFTTYESKLSSGQQQHNYHIRFVKFTNYQQFQSFILKYFIPYFESIKIQVVGGGAYKYKNNLKNLQNQKIKVDTNANQWQSIISALNFLQKNYSIKAHYITTNQIRSSFSLIRYFYQQNKYITFQETSKIQAPFIVANIGSGVSFLKIHKQNDQTKFQRIGGTSLGGGYFGGLAKFVNGDKFNFQKINELQNEETIKKALQICTNNLLQIMLLYCKVHNSKKALFLGSFCEVLSVRELIKKYIISKNIKDVEIYFSQFNGYLGVFGLLNNQIQKFHKQNSNI